MDMPLLGPKRDCGFPAGGSIIFPNTEIVSAYPSIAYFDYA